MWSISKRAMLSDGDSLFSWSLAINSAQLSLPPRRLDGGVRLFELDIPDAPGPAEQPGNNQERQAQGDFDDAPPNALLPVQSPLSAKVAKGCEETP
jgi:hypothetical protein